MSEINFFTECGVPKMFASANLWLDNGDIVDVNNPTGRIVFMECENLDPLFANIGEIIGMPIERMLINIMARV